MSVEPEPSRETDDRPRRLVRVIARLNVGGPARHVIRVDRPLRELGWRTTVITGRPGPGEGDLVEEARAHGLDVRVVPTLGRAVRPSRDLRALAAVGALIRRLAPDVVHTHTAKAGAVGRAAALTVRPRPVLVHTFHGHVLRENFAAPASRAFAAIERRLARVTDRLVAVAGPVRDELVETFGVGRREQYAIVPPGVDPERTRADRAAGRRLRAELGIPRDAVVVGSVGRLARVKRVDRVLEAFTRLRRARACAAPRAAASASGAPWLLVVGDGPEADGLRGSSECVRRLAPRSDLRAVYGAIDVLALASDAEGLPQVVVEAMHGGLAVVASAVGGVPTLIRDGVDGVLVPRGDVDALTNALERLVADEGRRRALGAAARARDVEAHRGVAVARALADVYRDALGSRLARSRRERHAAPPCTSSS